MFNETYSGKEDVQLFQNEVFITAGADKKRITDSNFVIGTNKRHYNIECQSSSDGTIIVRIFEYAIQTAITTADTDICKTKFILPASGILYLRSSENIPDKHIIEIDTPGGPISYDVPVLRISDYSLNDMLDKKLWFLIPFYFFYNLKEMSGNADKITEMEQTYTNLWIKFEQYVNSGTMKEYEKLSIKAMCDKVAKALSVNYADIAKGVDTVMGGQVLEYEAKRILNEGKVEGITETYASLVADGIMTIDTAAERAGLSKEEMQALVDKLTCVC